MAHMCERTPLYRICELFLPVPPMIMCRFMSGATPIINTSSSVTDDQVPHSTDSVPIVAVGEEEVLEYCRENALVSPPFSAPVAVSPPPRAFHRRRVAAPGPGGPLRRNPPRGHIQSDEQRLQEWREDNPLFRAYASDPILSQQITTTSRSHKRKAEYAKRVDPRDELPAGHPSKKRKNPYQIISIFRHGRRIHWTELRERYVANDDFEGRRQEVAEIIQEFEEWSESQEFEFSAEFYRNQGARARLPTIRTESPEPGASFEGLYDPFGSIEVGGVLFNVPARPLSPTPRASEFTSPFAPEDADWLAGFEVERLPAEFAEPGSPILLRSESDESIRVKEEEEDSEVGPERKDRESDNSPAEPLERDTAEEVRPSSPTLVILPPLKYSPSLSSESTESEDSDDEWQEGDE